MPPPFTVTTVEQLVQAVGNAGQSLVKGGLKTRGKGIPALELNGSIEHFHVEGGLEASGGGFEKI